MWTHPARCAGKCFGIFGSVFYSVIYGVDAKTLHYEEEIFTQSRDIWACGVVMYYVTYKKHPFLENSKMNTNLNIYEGSLIFQNRNKNLLKFEFMNREDRFKNAILVILPSIETFVIWFVNKKLEFCLDSFLSTNLTNSAWNWWTKKWKQKGRSERKIKKLTYL